MKGSYRELFIRNGNVGEEIYRHPHFLKFLSYFIYGAKLPEPVIKAFSDEVTKCEPVTSGDIVPLGKSARTQARLYRLSPHSAAEEFYKLALDCGLSQMYASAVRQSVKQAR